MNVLFALHDTGAFPHPKLRTLRSFQRFLQTFLRILRRSMLLFFSQTLRNYFTKYSLSCLLAVPALLMFSVAHGQSLEPLHWRLIDPEPIKKEVSDKTLQQEDCCTAFQVAPGISALSDKADISIEPLFSSQAGSWLFEPFTNQGLFQIIADHQSLHPRAVFVRNGSTNLHTLAKVIDNDSIIEAFKDGFLLHYPLIIDQGAALQLQADSLYLDASAGTVVINLGKLYSRDSRIGIWHSSAKKHAQKAFFRSFIMAWAGSETHIENSELSKLGFNGYLTKGLTLARHSQQDTATLPATLILKNSSINDLASGLEVSDSRVLVENNTFNQSRHFAVSVHNSRSSIRHNSINQTFNESAIRISGHSPALIMNNHIVLGGKAGIELSAVNAAVTIRNNTIATANRSAIYISQSGQTAAHVIDLIDNVAEYSQRFGLEMDGLQFANVVGNTLRANGQYAISLRNPPGAQAGRVLLTGNTMDVGDVAALRTENVKRLVLGPNQIESTQLTSQFFAGDLMALQTPLMEHTIIQTDFVEIDGRN
jgi:poly(beta-D-mannuronate) C5 epimerase